MYVLYVHGYSYFSKFLNISKTIIILLYNDANGDGVEGLK